MYNTNPRKSQFSQSLTELFAYFGSTLEFDELISSEETLDHHWNLIPLQSPIHEAWGNAECAVKCLGIYPKGDKYIVNLQFHWLNVNKFTRSDLKNFDVSLSNFSRMVGDTLYPEFPNEGGDILRLDTTRIRTGDIFNITMPNEDDAKKMKVLIDAQWVVLRIAAMSGEVLDFHLSSQTHLDFDNVIIREMLEARDGIPVGRSKADVSSWVKSQVVAWEEGAAAGTSMRELREQASQLSQQ